MTAILQKVSAIDTIAINSKSTKISKVKVRSLISRLFFLIACSTKAFFLEKIQN